MLDSAGKMLERLVLARLNAHLDNTGQRAENQFGFRKGCSTTDAIDRVLLAARGAAVGAVQHRDLCTAVLLDVRNAFNSVPWRNIDLALRSRSVPPSLVHLIRSYLEDRDLLVGEARSTRRVTCGVPQGSVLGPALWNIFYDDLLTIAVPPGVQLVGFADDVAVVGIARDGARTTALLNPVLANISSWMSNNGLQLAPHKTEAIVLTRKHKFAAPELIVEGHQIPIKRTARYLGVELDSRLSFTHHIATASSKAAHSARAIGRLMPNIGGPSQSKRALLGSVIRSKILYGATVWAGTGTKTAKNRSAMARVQRTIALRTTRAYRTVSADASLVLSSTIPADLLALECSRIRQRMEEVERTSSSTDIRREERCISIAAWQRRWDRSTKGRWTHSLLPDIERWLAKAPPLTFHTTQALTGHGCFRSYLARMHRADDSMCLYCGAEDDTAEHTIFVCPHWEEKRSPVTRFLGGRAVAPGDVQDLLCGPTGLSAADLNCRAAAKRATCAFIEMVEAIMSNKEEDERENELAHVY